MRDETAEQIANNLENIYGVLNDINDSLVEIKKELHKTRMGTVG